MVNRGFGRYALSIGMLAMTLGSCAQMEEPPLAPSTSAMLGAGVGGSVSWMLPQAKNDDLIYVSDQGAQVYALSYPDGKLVGTLEGFNGSAGECVDASGNVWIADEVASEIVEYAHGGTKRIATLRDRAFYPQGCAVDPTTGNLAVTNFTGFKGTGDLLVYNSAQGKPKRYVNSAFAQYYFCAYDAKGDLFADGTGGGLNQYAVLLHGSSSLQTIELPQDDYIMGSIQRDGKSMVWAGFPALPVLYRTTGINGHVDGSTDLDTGATLTFWIENHTVIAGGYSRGLSYWKYPAGGAPFQSVRGPFFPDYIVVSHAGGSRR
jgi:hypothetical protein